MRLSLILALFTLLLLPMRLWAVKSDIRFEQYTTENGLAHDSVNDVVQDHQGFIWFATSDGLSRFDGYQFKTFRHDPKDVHSLAANGVYKLHIDSAERLWIGTLGGGLNRFDEETERFIRYTHQPNNEHSISSNTIRVIKQGPSGKLWVGTENGLNSLDIESGRFERYLHDSADPNSLNHNKIRALAFDPQARLWVATSVGGISMLDPQQSRFFHIRAEQLNPMALSDDSVLALYFDRQNRLWVGTFNGLDRLDNWADFPHQKPRFSRFYHQSDNPKSISDHRIWSILEDSQQQLWVGTWGGGLNRLIEGSDFVHYRAKLNSRDSLTGNIIGAIYEDRQQNLWLATSKGVSKINRQQQLFSHYQGEQWPDLSSEDVIAMYRQSDGTLWVGTNNGLYQILPAGGYKQFTHQPNNDNSLSDNRVHSLAEDQQGNIWIATHYGLNRYHRDSNRFERFYHHSEDPNSLSHDDVNVILKDSQGVMWFGTSNGLSRFDPQSRRFSCYLCTDTELPDHQNYIFSMIEGKPGRFWLGTWDGGLVYLNPDNGAIERYRHDPEDPNSLSSDRVNSIYQDPQAFLWLATDNGLNRFDRTNRTFKRYHLNSGRAGVQVDGLTVDPQQRLWLSSLNGLIRFNPNNGRIRHYNRQDGLNIKAFRRKSYLRDENNRLYFGGSGGFVSFDPNEIVEDNYIPNVVLTELLLANRVATINGL